jgi:pimeloyl-ACP methyl ester carboxylesterase
LSTGRFGDPAGRAAAHKLRVPLLFVVARGDVLDETTSLYRAASSKDKHLLVVPGTAHAYFQSDPSGPLIRARVLSFIRSHTGT